MEYSSLQEASPLREHTYHMGSHSITCHPAEVTFPPLPQPKLVLNVDVTEARDSEWQWHQLAHTQVCISLQTDNHVSTPPLTFLQAGGPSCHPTNSIKALKVFI